MAAKEKDTPDKEEKVQESTKKKSPMKLIIILFIAAVIVGGGGAVAFFILSKGNAATEKSENASAEVKKEPEKISPGPFHKLDPFIVNLSDSAGRRYLKVAVELELGSEDLEKEISNRLPQIRDTVLLLLSTKTFGDVETDQGKMVLKEELLHRINAVLTTGLVKKIYFTDFVVQ